MRTTLLCIIIWNVFAPPSGTSQSYYWKTWGKEDGFRIGRITCHLEDSQGYIWLGSHSGLLRFNGQSLELFTSQEGLPHDYVTGIVEDHRTGQIYVSTTQGSCVYDGSRFQQLTDIPIWNAPFLKHIDGEGRFYFTTREGMYIVEQEKTTRYSTENGLASNNVKSLLVDNQRVLIGTSKSIQILSNETISSIPGAELITNARQIRKTPDGMFYILNGMGEVMRYDGGVFERIFQDNFISGIAVTSQGELIAFGLTALHMIHRNKPIESISNLPGDPSLVITYGFVDQQDNLWAVKDQRLMLRVENPFSYYYCADTPNCIDDYTALGLGQDGQLMIGSEFGAWILDSNQIKPLFGRVDGGKATLNSLIQDNQKTWWCSFQLGGIASFDGENFREYYHDGETLNDLFTFKMFKDRQENIWVGRRAHYLKIANGEISEHRPSGLADHDATTITQDQHDQVWIGSAHGDLFLVKGDSALNAGFHKHRFIKLLSHNGYLWASTIGSGLMQFSTTKMGEIKLEASYNPSTGFPLENILDFIFDRDGYLWACLFDRLLRVDLSVDGGRVVQYTMNDKYIPYGFRSDAFALDHENRLWIAGEEALLMLDLEDFSPSNTPMPLHISAVDLFYEPINLEQWKTNNSGAYVFNRKKNFLRIHYDAIFYQNPDKITYQYMLEGLEPDWSPTTKIRNVSYPNLAPGDYVFKVTADNGSGFQTDPVQFSFTIVPPIWKHPLFILLLGLLLFGAIYTLFRMRVRSIRSAEARKTEINKQLSRLEVQALRAKMNPHFIFNALNSIQHLIIENNEKAALAYLSKFSKLIRQLLDNAMAAEVNLKEEIEMLRNYIELESLRFDHNFDYEIIIDPELLDQEVQIPYLLVQPFVENAINHGLIHKEGKGNLHVGISGKRDSVEFVVEDNGIGRVAAGRIRSRSNPKHKSHGIDVSSSRLQLIHPAGVGENAIKIIDLYASDNTPAGTRVEITIPLKAG